MTRLVVPVLACGVDVVPRAVGLLLLLEVADAVADGSLDVFLRVTAPRAVDAATQAGECTSTSDGDHDGRSEQGISRGEA